MRPETILFVIGIRVSNSKCIYYFDMAKDKFLARNCSGRKDGRGVAGGGFTARLSQHKLEARRLTHFGEAAWGPFQKTTAPANRLPNKSHMP